MNTSPHTRTDEHHPSADDLNAWLASLLQVQRYPPDEQGGFYRPGSLRVGSLVCALEPTPPLYATLSDNAVGALWLHRPWKLDLTRLPSAMPVLYHHLPFDETLTLGYNAALADPLDLTDLEPFGYKQAGDLPRRPIGMLGRVPRKTLGALIGQLEEQFGGVESVTGSPIRPVDRLVVAGAMTEALVLEAAGRGAEVYLTGQFRQPARRAVEATGLAVVTVGHLRSEQWGVRTLGALLAQAFPGLRVHLVE